MGKKKKQKKISAKKEKYAKFKKPKPSVLDLKMPDLDDEQVRQKRDDEQKIERFMKFSKNSPPKEIVARKAMSKR